MLRLNNIPLKELDELLLTRNYMTEVLSRCEPIEALDRVRAIPAHVEHDVAVQVAVDSSTRNHVGANVGRDRPAFTLDLLISIDTLEQEHVVSVNNVQRVGTLTKLHAIILDEEEVHYFLGRLHVLQHLVLEELTLSIK